MPLPSSCLLELSPAATAADLSLTSRHTSQVRPRLVASASTRGGGVLPASALSPWRAQQACRAPHLTPCRLERDLPTRSAWRTRVKAAAGRGDGRPADMRGGALGALPAALLLLKLALICCASPGACGRGGAAGACGPRGTPKGCGRPITFSSTPQACHSCPATPAAALLLPGAVGGPPKWRGRALPCGGQLPGSCGVRPACPGCS